MKIQSHENNRNKHVFTTGAAAAAGAGIISRYMPLTQLEQKELLITYKDEINKQASAFKSGLFDALENGNPIDDNQKAARDLFVSSSEAIIGGNKDAIDDALKGADDTLKGAFNSMQDAFKSTASEFKVSLYRKAASNIKKERPTFYFAVFAGVTAMIATTLKNAIQNKKQEKDEAQIQIILDEFV